MSTTLTRHTSDGTTVGTAPIPRQSFGTLLRVELRKLTDTRSGKILLSAAVLVSAALLIYKTVRTGEGDTVMFRNFNMALLPALMVLVPMLGLVAMTSEWTQRTALTTFTMSPRRLRVIGAKFVAALTLSSVVLAATTLLTLAATAIAGAVSGGGAQFTDVGAGVRETVVMTLLQVVMASAFGALVPITPVAVGAFIMAPTVWSALGPDLLGTSSRWLDVFEAYDRLGSLHPWEQLGQTMTSIGVWVALPAVVGVWRFLRREVK